MNDTNRSAPSSPETPECVQTATDALERAKAELEKAQATYENVCRQAAERVKAVREATVGDLIDNTLAAVRRYPAASVSAAAVIGFFLGRLFRR